MIAAWMLYSVGVGVLIGVACLAGDRFCRLLRVQVRWVWAVGMCATLLLSSIALVRLWSVNDVVGSGMSVALIEVDAGTPEASGYAESVARVALETLAMARATIAAAAERAYGIAAGSAGDGRGLWIAWGVCSLLLLVVLAATLQRVRRARTGWRDHRIGEVRVLVSRNTGPALVGLVRPSIVVPSWLLDEPAERQRLVVQHEDEHRRAGDHAMLATACIIVCLLPWNIALWFMLLRTRLAVELDCDARVLRHGVMARSYGSLLLEIAGRTRARPFGAPALADSRTHLERRLIAMTESNRTPRRVRASATGLFALLLGAAACSTDLPTAAAIDEMDVQEVQVQAEQAGLLVPLTEGEGPLFIVDGEVVTEEAARELAPEAIERIEVLRRSAATAVYGERAESGAVLVETRANRTATISGRITRGAKVSTVGGIADLREAELGAKAVEGVAMKQGVPLEAVERTALTLRELRAEREAVLVEEQRASTFTFEENGAPTTKALILLDGVEASSTFKLRSLSPESIERIEIIKGPAARELYDDPRAVNGVIRITTKKQ